MYHQTDKLKNAKRTHNFMGIFYVNFLAKKSEWIKWGENTDRLKIKEKLSTIDVDLVFDFKWRIWISLCKLTWQTKVNKRKKAEKTGFVSDERVLYCRRICSVFKGPKLCGTNERFSSKTQIQTIQLAHHFEIKQIYSQL